MRKTCWTNWRESLERGTPLFEREHHQRIAKVLEALDPGVLARNHCLFGGGTAIALRHGEYRESVDIDFMVSDLAGYRELRQLLTAPGGIAGLALPDRRLEQAREIRADQYGIRTVVAVDGAGIKFEIVLEARIRFDPPGKDDEVCGIATLTELDMVASKLLANADRWADDSICSRDLIDLAMMEPGKALLHKGLEKARVPYGDSVDKALAKAIAALLQREGHIERCMKTMRMTVPKALLWQRIQTLQKVSA
jgi:hypothetical protein